VTSGSEVDSGDVLGLLGDDGVDDGVWEGLASSPAWAASSIASYRGGKERLELGSVAVWLWAWTNTSNTKECRGWRSYQGTRDVEASLLAKPTGTRWSGGWAIAHRSFGRRPEGSARKQSGARILKKTRKEEEAVAGGFIVG
jgi:hypothetical protein